MATAHLPVHRSTPSGTSGSRDDGADVNQLSPAGSAGEPIRSAGPLDSGSTALTDLAGDVVAAVMSGLQQVGWAEAEIERASAEHPAHADALYHAFGLLAPTVDVMRTEFVYRSHCRELLARVVAGGDTRAPTHAEVAAACSEASQLAPLNLPGFTVYMRAWTAAFPDKVHIFGDAVDPYEYVAGSEADALERKLRRRLTVKDRAMRGVSCPGRHHGEPAPNCRYFTPEQLSLPVTATGGDAR